MNYFHDDAGAPSCGSAASGVINVLNACLVTGFGSVELSSLTVSGEVATGTKAGHGFTAREGADIEIAGALFASINGRKSPLTANVNEFTFAAPGVPDGPVQGTITAKRPSLGWALEFADVDKAVYKRTDVFATGQRLLVHDSAGFIEGGYQVARLWMVDNVTSIDQFVGQKPSGDSFCPWIKAAPIVSWSLIGGSRGFYLFTGTGPLVAAPGGFDHVQLFSDFESFANPDNFNTVIAGQTPSYNALSSSQSYGSPYYESVAVAARNYSQGVGTSPLIVFSFGTGQSGGASLPPAVNPAGGRSLINHRCLFTEPGGGYRGYVPGLIHMLNSRPGQHREVVDIDAALAGRKMMVFNTSGQAGNSQVGIDITGPWL
jgi:hypothetical protein